MIISKRYLLLANKKKESCRSGGGVFAVLDGRVFLPLLRPPPSQTLQHALDLRIRLSLAANLLLEQRLSTLLSLLQSLLELLLHQGPLSLSDQIRVLSGSFPVGLEVGWWWVSLLESVVRGSLLLVVLEVVTCRSKKRREKERSWSA